MLIRIEVACALPDQQCVKTLDVEDGCTAQQAVMLSGMAGVFPALALAECKLGIFSKLIENPERYVLAEGDRVEIYRPLLLDPKEARRQRAKKARK